MQTVDIVIPCHPKDLPILGPCIDSVRRFVPDAGRIYVVSRERIDAGDTWIPEDDYHFSREDCERLLPSADGCARWYLQQLLKLLAPIGTRYLALDADVVFQREVRLLADDGVPFYSPGPYPHHAAYFAHMARLLPGLVQHCPPSAIAHHYVVDPAVRLELVYEVCEAHYRPFWEAYLACVDPAHVTKSGAADNEVWINYALWRAPGLLRERKLRWEDTKTLDPRPDLDFIACHSWLAGRSAP